MQTLFILIFTILAVLGLVGIILGIVIQYKKHFQQDKTPEFKPKSFRWDTMDNIDEEFKPLVFPNYKSRR